MKDIRFITAQPDVPYFHWQCELYIHNFIKSGIDPKQIHILFSIFSENNPSPGALLLINSGVNVHFYIDEREDKSYIPSIKPYLLWKFLDENPDFSKMIFLHDSDIVFRKLPNFQSLIDDDIIYLADTISYIGYDYISNCCEQYERQHTHLKQKSLIDKMTDVIGIDPDRLISNQSSSGGGQYLIKKSTALLWKKIYEDSTPLYKAMIDFHSENPISGGIQFWTAEMWSTLWNFWHFGYQTKINTELDFSWATDNIKMYDQKNILHMAGVTNELKHRMFYKGDYINVSPIEKLINNPRHFDYIDSDNSTFAYIEIMKQYIKENK